MVSGFQARIQTFNDDQRRNTHLLLNAHVSAYMSHLDDGGARITRIAQLVHLNRYFESKAWCANYTHSSSVKIVDFGPRHIDGYGRLLWFKEMNGLLFLTSSGSDGLPNTADDAEIVFGPAEKMQEQAEVDTGSEAEK